MWTANSDLPTVKSEQIFLCNSPLSILFYAQNLSLKYHSLYKSNFKETKIHVNKNEKWHRICILPAFPGTKILLTGIYLKISMEPHSIKNVLVSYFLNNQSFIIFERSKNKYYIPINIWLTYWYVSVKYYYIYIYKKIIYLYIIFFFFFQCNICRIILHLCYCLGSWAVYIIWNFISCFFNFAECDSLHFHSSYIFPTFSWRLQMVVEVNLLCWVCNNKTYYY